MSLTIKQNRIKSKRAKKLRERLSEAQNHRCCYCGCDIRNGATIEHVISRYRGGSNDWGNLVASCDPCNQKSSWASGSAGPITEQELLAIMAGT